MIRKSSKKLRSIKNPFRGYRKHLKVSDHCEICSITIPHPSLGHADHIKERYKFKQEGKKIQHEGNLCFLCVSCHNLKTNEVIKIVRYRKSTGGDILEWYFTEEPEIKLYGSQPKLFER